MLCLYVELEDDLVEDILVDVYLCRPLLETGGLVRAYLDIFIPEVAVSVENSVGIDADNLLRKSGDIQGPAGRPGFYSYCPCDCLFRFFDLPVKLSTLLVGKMFLLEQ